MRRELLSGPCCLTVLSWCSGGLAEPGSALGGEWSWREDPGLTGCAEQSEIRARVEARLAASGGAGAIDAGLVTLVELSRLPGGHSARVSVQLPGEPREERELTSDGPDCRDLDEALVLSLSLLLSNTRERAAPRVDSEGAQVDQKPERIQGKSFRPGLEVAGKVATDPQPEGMRGGPVARLGMGPVASLGQIPGLAVGGMLGVSVPVRGSWSVTAGASYLGTRQAEKGAARFAFSATEAWLGGRHTNHWMGGGWLDLEVAALVGWLHAVPKSLDPVDPGDSGFGGLRLGAAVGRPLTSRLGISFGVAGHLLANTWRFHVRGAEEPVWTQPRAGARLEMRVTWGEQ